MEFAYDVPNKGPGFISIYRLESVDFERTKSEHHHYILNESELAEYLKTHPGCCSLALNEDTKKEEKRLHEKYGLEMFGRED